MTLVANSAVRRLGPFTPSMAGPDTAGRQGTSGVQEKRCWGEQSWALVTPQRVWGNGKDSKSLAIVSWCLHVGQELDKATFLLFCDCSRGYRGLAASLDHQGETLCLT